MVFFVVFDNLYKKFVPRSGPTVCQSWSWSKPFETLKVFLKEVFKNVNLEKNQQNLTYTEGL